MHVWNIPAKYMYECVCVVWLYDKGMPEIQVYPLVY